MSSSSRCEMWTTPTPFARRSRMIRNSSSISVSVSAAVGSSITRTAALSESALAISTICCWAILRSPTRARGSSLRCSRSISSPRLPVEPPIVEQEARPAARLAAQEDVLGDRQVRRQVQLLVDHADAEVQRRSRVGDLDRLALEPDLAGVGLVDAGQDLHQRGLAGAVLADQGVDFSGTELEASVGKRMDAGEVLGDPGHLDQQVTHRELLEACRPQWDGAATSMRQPRARLSGSNVGYWYRTAWISGSLMLVLSYQ